MESNVIEELYGRYTDKTMVRTKDIDVIKIMNHGISISNYECIDECPTESAHKDWIQLIPPSTGLLPNAQFRLAELNNISIKDSKVVSTGKLQGMFGSDGLFNNINVERVVVDTNSQHKVTFNGLMGGNISDITLGNGDPARVLLQNARIGGGSNIWVESFKGIEYNEVTGDSIVDHRGRRDVHRNQRVFADFDLEGWLEYWTTREYVSLKDHLKEIDQVVGRFGTLVNS